MAAINQVGYSLWSNDASVDAPTPNPPAAPTNLTATAKSSTQIDIAWVDNSNNEAGFKIERKKSKGGLFSQVGMVYANQATYADHGLIQSTDYTYRVLAYNRGGDSPYSNEANAVTHVAPPADPSRLAVDAVTPWQVDLSWLDNSHDEAEFKIERMEIGGGGGYAEIHKTGANTTRWSDTGCDPDTTYSYRVRAWNAGGHSGYSNEAEDSTPYVPDPPASVIASAEDGRVTISWEDVTGAASYALYMDTAYGVKKTTSGANFQKVTGVASPYTYPGLNNGVTYYFVVTATDGKWESAESREVSGEPNKWVQRLSVGDVSSIAVDDTTPSTIYAGTKGDGVYKSLDGGLSWTQINAGLTNRMVCDVVTVAGRGLVYAGTGGGAFMSDNGGVSWSLITPEISTVFGLQQPNVPALALDPVLRGSVVNLGAPPTIYATFNNSIYRSFDGGVLWEEVVIGGAHDLAWDPTTDMTVYAAQSGGVLKSEQLGDPSSWFNMKPGILAFVLAIDSRSSQSVVYVGTERGSVFKSVDDGNSWSSLGYGLTADAVWAIAIDPKNPGVIYVGTPNGAYRSRDGGTSWSAIGLANYGVHAIAIDPTSPAAVHAGTDQGVFEMK